MPPVDDEGFRPTTVPYSVSLEHGVGWPYPTTPQLGEDARREVIGWLDLNITTGRYSQVLVNDLLSHLRSRTLDLFCIYDAIGTLESAPHSRPTLTKPETQFRHPPLKGLWHKHHNNGEMASLALNIKNHWGDSGMQMLIRNHLKVGSVIAKEDIGRLVHEMVITGYEERGRASEITGDWIVFAKHDGINYYLTLGKHGDDEAIAERVGQCEAEFPGVKLLEP